MMLPTDALVEFFVCDTAREDKDNKVSLLGIYPDRRLQLPADARFPAAFIVTFVFFLLDGEGPFEVTVDINTPTAQPPFRAVVPNIQKLANQPATVLVAFMPFVASGFGTYEVILTLNSQSYPRTFEVAPTTPKAA
jgi:hypothetical protein